MQLPARLLICTVCLLSSRIARAQDPALGALESHDEYPAPDDPGLRYRTPPAVAAGMPEKRFSVDLGFGYVSLLEDPDVAEGMGGGLSLSAVIYRRLGVELSAFFARNKYEAMLGDYGGSFLAGNLTLGPTLRLTPAGSRFLLRAELGLGTYLIVPVISEDSWTLGVSGGLSLIVRITSWLGVGLKWRYHLFNLATIAGTEFRDVKALMKVGVIDRMELPACLVFSF